MSATANPFDNIDPTLAEELSTDVLSGGEAIRLPFEVPYIQWHNGKEELIQVGGTAYFGGWDMSIDLLGNSLDEYGPLEGWAEAERVARDRTKYRVLTARDLYLLPIASRTAFYEINDPRKLHPTMIPGTRSRFQLLGLIATETDDDGKPVAWGPAVITTKSTQAGKFNKVIQDWDKHTDDIRGLLAKGLPAWVFWMHIGTFGSERVEEMVGSGNDRSPVAVIQLEKPDMTQETLIRLFAGQELMEQMRGYKELAREWLDAWSADALENREYSEEDEEEASEPTRHYVSPDTVAVREPEQQPSSLDFNPLADVTNDVAREAYLENFEKQHGITLKEAGKVTVPAGVASSGRTLSELMNSEHGKNIVRFLSGSVSAPDGTKFNPADYENGETVQRAASLFMETI